jgi:malate dehydrogenase
VSTTPVKVAVTGAAGQIGYSLLFRIASGALLGPDTPSSCGCSRSPGPQGARGRRHGARRLRLPDPGRRRHRRRPEQVFDGVNAAMLVGAMPRKEGMDRADLLAANGKIFTGQGAALNKVAADDIKILVTGNPANTNALIAMANAPDIPRSASTR